MVQPWIIKLAIDDLEKGIFSDRIGIYIGVIAGVTLLVCVCRFAMRLKIIGTSRCFEHDLRRHVFEHIQVLPKPFYDRVPTGDIMSRLTNDILRVRMVLGPAIMQIGNTLISLVFALSVMLAIDVRLTLLALIPLPLMPVMFYLMGRKIRFHSERVQEQMATITSCAQENLTGIRVVKAYNLEPIESAKFQKLSTEYVHRNLDLIRYQGLFMPLVVLLSGISTTFILFFCGWWVIQDRITLGSMVAFIEYLVILSWPMFAIGWVVGLVQQASAAMLRLQKMLDEEPSQGMLKTPLTEEPSLDGDIEFKNVTFRYGPDQPCVLSNVSFKIRKGETVALMGASGAGKSTIFSLLTRSYDPESGTIFINGRDIQNVSEYVIRKNIGIMPQLPVLFSQTILSNLEFGLTEESSLTIDDAIRMAHVDRDIREFSDSIHTRLGERGVNVSGGQKQRLTLARALLRDARILLLDDPFASVDISTEETILANLASFVRNRTAIVISHRINTAKRADRILILKDGAIAEEGSHDELFEHDGYYRDLCRKQALMDELEEL